MRLGEGGSGYVSKRWTLLEEDLVPYFAESPFLIHFIDVGTGDATVIDMGDKEIVTDGGNYKYDLNNYLEKNAIVQGNIELAVDAHGDQDHWKGLAYPLGLDGALDSPYRVQEFWDAGYDRDCNIPTDGNGRQNYLEFVADVEPLISAAGFKRPLEDHHSPSNVTNQVVPFSLASLPGDEFTVLHSESTPEQHGECSYMINNASIVLMVETSGIRMLLTGDANGKERRDNDVTIAAQIEGRLLALDNSLAENVLEADLLKAPHHGSETANTNQFIEAVDPEFVIFSASTGHHLPRPTEVSRYEDAGAIILRTDIDRPGKNQRDRYSSRCWLFKFIDSKNVSGAGAFLSHHGSGIRRWHSGHGN